MSTKLQADEKGTLHVPAALLPDPEPMATYHVHEQNRQIIISREKNKIEEEPFWKTASSEERLKAFREWAKEAGTPAGLSDYAVSRESMYD